jgi:hypothetical protein
MFQCELRQGKPTRENVSGGSWESDQKIRGKKWISNMISWQNL